MTGTPTAPQRERETLARALVLLRAERYADARDTTEARRALAVSEFEDALDAYARAIRATATGRRER